MYGKENFVPNCKDLLPTSADEISWKRILVIGDIHGHFTKFMSLYEKLHVTDDDLVIFLGDYIDRGPEVAEVLKWALTVNGRKNFIFLRGNHEEMMISALYDKNNWWRYSYGQVTLQSLKKWLTEDPAAYEKVVHFISNLPLYHEMEIGGRQYIFCHAGIETGIPMREQSAEWLLWSRREFYDAYQGYAVVTVGHTPLQTLKEHFHLKKFIPFRVPHRNILMIDTGSFIDKSYGFNEDGLISCVDILTGQFWQSR